MTYIQGPLPPAGPESIRPGAPGNQKADRTEGPEARDRVDISEMARLRAKLAASPAMRVDLVEEIKAAIEDGTYDAECMEKLEGAAQKILEALRREEAL